jgi:hypothetical protein
MGQLVNVQPRRHARRRAVRPLQQRHITGFLRAVRASPTEDPCLRRRPCANYPARSRGVEDQRKAWAEAISEVFTTMPHARKQVAGLQKAISNAEHPALQQPSWEGPQDRGRFKYPLVGTSPGAIALTITPCSDH